MSEQITDWLDEVQQRADAAKEGPWPVTTRYGEKMIPRVIPIARQKVPRLVGVKPDGEGVYIPEDQIEIGFAGSDADVEFIAASRTDLPAAVAALRAVMGLHAPVPPLSNPDPTPVCRNCDWDYPCPTVKAISTALGVEVTD